MQLYVLETGLIECSDYALFSPHATDREYRAMSVRSYLVVHPNGVLLWDTGIADSIAAQPAGERVADAIVFRVPTTLRSQLEANQGTADGIQQELQGGFAGELIGPEDRDYDDGRQVYNGMIDRRPALIARCAETNEVARTIGFARAYDLPLVDPDASGSLAARSSEPNFETKNREEQS